MSHRYLEVTYRDGKVLAAYFYLPRQSGDASARTLPYGDGLFIDFAADGRPIGIEITAPTRLPPDALNQALASVHQPPLTAAELAPLAAA